MGTDAWLWYIPLRKSHKLLDLDLVVASVLVTCCWLSHGQSSVVEDLLWSKCLMAHYIICKCLGWWCVSKILSFFVILTDNGILSVTKILNNKHQVLLCRIVYCLCQYLKYHMYSSKTSLDQFFYLKKRVIQWIRWFLPKELAVGSSVFNCTFFKKINSKKLTTLVKGDQKAPFSIATTPRSRGGCYSITWIAPLYPWSLPYNAEC